jgi:Pentapeptide repeats (9 copies)
MAAAVLGPGSELDARGTDISERLLDRLIAKFGAGQSGPVFATALFSEARFKGAVRLAGARFNGGAWFDGARFAGNATFAASDFGGNAVFTEAEFSADALFTDRSSFRKDAVFDDARFNGAANFDDATFAGSVGFSRVRFGARAWFGGETQGVSFSGLTCFDGAEFRDICWFRSAQFSRNATFKNTRFSGETAFAGARFGEGAQFTGARFDTAGHLGPLVVRDGLILDAAVFGQPVLIEVAATAVTVRHSTFVDATLRLRYAAVELDHATSAGPLTLTAAAEEFTVLGDDASRRSPVDESALSGTSRDAGPSLLSLRGVDASQVALVNVNLSQCRFADAHNLDQLHFEGNRSRFADPPGYFRVGPIPIWHYTNRQIIAEEWDWRTQRRRFAWKPQRGEQCPALEPERLLTLYRQLRKALEDAKNEPGAADFYYGEMEMRRHASTTPAGERFLLALYWALSGYGLRSIRALSALVIVLVLATAGFATVGFAASQTITYLPVGPAHPGVAVAYRQTAHAGPHPGWVSAVIYSLDSSTSLLNTSQPQPLTGMGNAVQILLKLLGPLFLGLALLAVRNRVKR